MLKETQNALDSAFSDVQIVKINSNISEGTPEGNKILQILRFFKDAGIEVEVTDQQSFRQRHPGIYWGLIITGVVLATSLILAAIAAIAIFTGGIDIIIIILTAIILSAIGAMCISIPLALFLSSNESIKFTCELKSSTLGDQQYGTISFLEKHLTSTEEIIDIVTNAKDRITEKEFNPLERDNDCVELISRPLKIVVSKNSEPTAGTSTSTTSTSTNSQNTSSYPYKVEFFGGKNLDRRINLKPGAKKTIESLCEASARFS